MKKFLCIVLCLCFVFSLGGCGSKMSFESEAEMLEYLNGIWKSGEEYYIFNDGAICEINDQTIVYELEEYFVEYIKENGYEAYITLGQEDALQAIETKILETYQQTDYALNVQKGKIIFEEGREFEETMVLGEECLEVETSIADRVYTKLSDEFDLTNENFTQCFGIAINEFKPSPDDFVLSVDKCAEKLKSYHSEINSYKVVTDGMWSNNGLYDNYNGAFFHNENTLMFVKKGVVGQYTYTYSPYVTVVQDQTGTRSLETLLQDALISVSEYPLAPSASELEDRYIQNGNAELILTVEGVKYEIYRTNYRYTIRIEVL